MYDCKELNERNFREMILQNPQVPRNFHQNSWFLQSRFLSSYVCLAVSTFSQSCLVVPIFEVRLRKSLSLYLFVCFHNGVGMCKSELDTLRSKTL